MFVLWQLFVLAERSGRIVSLLLFAHSKAYEKKVFSILVEHVWRTRGRQKGEARERAKLLRLAMLHQTFFFLSLPSFVRLDFSTLYMFRNLIEHELMPMRIALHVWNKAIEKEEKRKFIEMGTFL